MAQAKPALEVTLLASVWLVEGRIGDNRDDYQSWFVGAFGSSKEAEEIKAKFQSYADLTRSEWEDLCYEADYEQDVLLEDWLKARRETVWTDLVARELGHIADRYEVIEVPTLGSLATKEAV